jgi:hypothetical protein
MLKNLHHEVTSCKLVHKIKINIRGECVVLSSNQDGITIGTVSGGIVNFGGAVYISPISITKTNSGAGENNTGGDGTTGQEMNSENQKSVTELLDLIKTMLG